VANPVRIETDNGYVVEFPQGLEENSGRVLDDPRENEMERIGLPFVIRGKPGLINARFQFQKEGDVRDDVLNYDISSVLRPGGVFTNFTSSVHELRGEATVPKRYFPTKIRSIVVQNLSDASPPGAKTEKAPGS